MTKINFLLSLNEKLSGLPRSDVEERLNFYSEMIEDRIEEGLSEEEAVAAIGSVDDVASQIIADIPLSRIAKEKIKRKRHLKAWEIVLLVLGSPLWLPLLIAAIAVLLSLYAVLWSAIITIWALFASLAACGIGGIAAGIIFICTGNVFSGIALIGAALFSAGLSIFSFFGCLAATKGTVSLTKKIILSIKKCFIKKEDTL